jgi:hypothetical protein
MQPPAKISDLNNVFSQVLQGVITLAGIAVLVMLIVGGFQYLSAGGDKEGAQRASRTLTFAIGGLVLLLSSWLIIKLLADFLGIDVPSFTICLPGQTC